MLYPLSYGSVYAIRGRMLTRVTILTKILTRPIKLTALRDKIFKKRGRGAVLKCADYGGVGGAEG